MTRVTIVEERMGGRVRAILATEGFEVELVPELPEVLEKTLESGLPDLVLIEAPAISSSVVSLVEAVVRATRVPVAVLSESNCEDGILDGYRAGAAAVLAEPIGARELVARIRAVLRRSNVDIDLVDDVVRVGPIVLDRARRALTVDGEVVQLPRREFDIAEVLMRKSGTVVHRRLLLAELWGSGTRDSKSLDVQVGRLRARLAEVEGHRRIVTIRGVGYRFVTDEDLRRSRDSWSGRAPQHG